MLLGGTTTQLFIRQAQSEGKIFAMYDVVPSTNMLRDRRPLLCNQMFAVCNQMFPTNSISDPGLASQSKIIFKLIIMYMRKDMYFCLSRPIAGPD